MNYFVSWADDKAGFLKEEYNGFLSVAGEEDLKTLLKIIAYNEQYVSIEVDYSKEQENG